MEIVVQGENWGEGRRHDVQALLANVAATFFRYFESPPQGRINVVYRANENPMVVYRPPGTTDYLIFLSAHGRRWAQYSYQFAHEICHIASDCERLKAAPSRWFHEVLCELASLFVLRRMAEDWVTHPPYPNWGSYAPSLADYASIWLQMPDHRLPPSVTLGAWIRDHEALLRTNPYQRVLNGVVAAALLPLIEAMPLTWQAVAFMPDSEATFDEFLSAWERRCPAQYRPFVAGIQTLVAV
jgi:hypothetical protein